MSDAWKDYQDEAAAFFRSLGLEAKTNVTVRGVRTAHDIDVLVKAHHVGFEVTWVVECKCWKARVTKLHVMALREIVSDLGADRGILLSEAGFQSGAVEAAALTNVRVTSLADVRNSAGSEIVAMRLRDLYDRIESCKRRYWEIPKESRIAHGLRPEVGGGGYSSRQILEVSTELVTKAFRGAYPIEPESLAAAVIPGFLRQFPSADSVLRVVEPMIGNLESLLKACEDKIGKPGL